MPHLNGSQKTRRLHNGMSIRVGELGVSTAFLIIIKECQEYGNAVYVDTSGPTMMKFSNTHRISECGIVSVPLIIGGTSASPKEFPHMAIIGFANTPTSNEIAWDCGGSLISEQYVLTASHCLRSREKGESQLVRLGLISLKSDDSEDLQEKRVADRIAHPNYDRATKRNDIGLIRLESPVHFTPYVRPACLNLNRVASQSHALATGFGKQSYDSSKGSSHLMKVQLMVYEMHQCAKGIEVTNSMLCAGYVRGGKDTCQGDSGGPLQTVLSKPYCMYNLIGITSFGRFCGFANSPAIYTNVSSFVSWIEDIVWP